MVSLPNSACSSVAAPAQPKPGPKRKPKGKGTEQAEPAAPCIPARAACVFHQRLDSLPREALGHGFLSLESDGSDVRVLLGSTLALRSMPCSRLALFVHVLLRSLRLRAAHGGCVGSLSTHLSRHTSICICATPFSYFFKSKSFILSLLIQKIQQ